MWHNQKIKWSKVKRGNRLLLNILAPNLLIINNLHLSLFIFDLFLLFLTFHLLLSFYFKSLIVLYMFQ